MALSLCPLPAGAQGSDEIRPSTTSLAGYVTTLQGERLEGAEVDLVFGAGQNAVTDAEGRFHLEPVPAGAWTVRIRYDGLRFEREVQLRSGTTTRKTYRLDVSPDPQEPLQVSVSASHGKMRGFEKRRSRRRGTFITRSDIAREDPLVMSDLLRGRPRIRFRVAPDGSRELRLQSPQGSCEPAFFVDGDRVTTFRLDDMFPEHVQAIEVYSSPSAAPARYRHQTRCGVILVWVREDFQRN